MIDLIHGPVQLALDKTPGRVQAVLDRAFLFQGDKVKERPFFRGMSKTAITALILSEIEKQVPGESFESELIADLLSGEHFFFSTNGLRPTTYRKSANRGTGYILECFCHEKWHRISWLMCLEKGGYGNWLTNAMRMAANPFVAAHKRKNPVCEVCNKAPATAVDHVQPEFKIISNLAYECLAQLPIEVALHTIDARNEAIIIACKGGDWEKGLTPLLSADSVAVSAIVEAHRTAVLQSVCNGCHVKNAADRRLKRS